MDAEQTPGAASTDKPAETSAPAQEQSGKGKGSWLDRVLFRGSRSASEPDLRASTTGPAPKADETPEEPKAGEAKSSDQSKADAAAKAPEAKGASQPTEPEKPRTLTPAEFAQTEEGKRAIQAEVDRREAKRQADAEARQKIEDRRRLRKEDPAAYAEADDQAEAEHERIKATGEQLAGLWDAAVVNPFVERLTPEEQAELLQEIPAGLEGRRVVLEKVIQREVAKARKEAAAEADQKAQERLRKNPAFRKELALEMRGQEEEPELLPAPSGANLSFDMNTLIRQKASNPRTGNVTVRN